MVKKQEDNLICNSVKKSKDLEIHLNKQVKTTQWNLSNTDERNGRRQASVNIFLINLYLQCLKCPYSGLERQLSS